MPVGIEPQTAAKPRFAGELGLRRTANEGDQAAVDIIPVP